MDYKIVKNYKLFAKQKKHRCLRFCQSRLGI